MLSLPAQNVSLYRCKREQLKVKSIFLDPAPIQLLDLDAGGGTLEEALVFDWPSDADL